LLNARNARDDADKRAWSSAKSRPAVVDNDDHGDDSGLYEAMGYVRKSGSKSGLTRKTAQGQRPPT
jgi:hypothetical protein